MTEFNGKCVVKLRLPAQYLSLDATEEKVKAFEMYKGLAKKISETGYGTIVFPSLTDSDGNYLFDLEVYYP